MSEMTIKPRARPAKDETVADVDAPAKGAKPAPKKVIKLGAKERLNPYVTPEQRRKLLFLAADRDCSMSEIIGVLIDEAEDPKI